MLSIKKAIEKGYVKAEDTEGSANLAEALQMVRAKRASGNKARIAREVIERGSFWYHVFIKETSTRIEALDKKHIDEAIK